MESESRFVLIFQWHRIVLLVEKKDELYSFINPNMNLMLIGAWTISYKQLILVPLPSKTEWVDL